MRKLRKGGDADGLKGDKEKLKGVIVIKNKQLFFETVVCFIAVCYLYLYFAFLKNIDSENYSAFYFNITYIIIIPIFYFTLALIITNFAKYYLVQKKYNVAMKKFKSIGILLLVIYIVMLTYFFITNSYPFGFIFLINNPWIFIIPGFFVALGY